MIVNQVSIFICSVNESIRNRFYVVCCSALRDKARELNSTLGLRNGAPEKSVNEMNDEIQAMLTELRKRQLSGKKRIAEEEER